MDTQINWKPSLDKGAEPLYLSLVRALIDDVHSGRLATGTRLPTQRELADELKVALGTVTRAYAEAERRGLVYGDGRRGTYVGEPSTPRTILASLNKSVVAGIDLSRNHPNYSLDPDLSVALRRIAKVAENQRLLEYPPPSGFQHHREAGARWLTALGMKTTADSVFLTVGAQQATVAVLAAECRPGDIVATEALTYPGAKSAADMLGLELIGVETDVEGLLPEALESLCHHKHIRAVYCSPTYQNPTNAVMSNTRRHHLAELGERFGFFLVEDQILAPLLDEPLDFLTSLAPERGYCIMSASKTVAAGLRVGFVVAPKKSHQRLIEVLQLSSLGMPGLMGELFTQWYDDGTVDQVITRRKQDIRLKQRMALEQLKDYTFHTHPTSYHIWLELPESWTSLNFAIEAQMRGVTVSPADVFAVDRRSTVRAVRLSVGGVMDPAMLATGLAILRNLLSGVPSENRATV